MPSFDGRKIRQTEMAVLVEVDIGGRTLQFWLPRTRASFEGGQVTIDAEYWKIKDAELKAATKVLSSTGEAAMMNTMRQWTERRDAFILKLQSGAEAEVVALQRQLFDRLYDKAIAAMQTENGVVLFNEANMATVARLNELFDGFTRASQGVAGKIGESLIDISLMGVDYAETMGIDRNEIARIVEKLDLMQQRLGVKVVSEAGKDIVKVQPGGYIDTLAQSDKVKADIASYVTRSVAGKASLSEYSTGLRDLVEGAEDADGALLKYYKTYAWDSYHEVEAETNNFFADEMGLEWFVYQGDVIDDSRPFCVEHAGKVYNRDDAARFDTMEWQGKKPGPFLVERGGYNCRHMIDWISEETAMMMKEGGL